MSHTIYEELAMMSLESSYPKYVQELDELRELEKTKAITPEQLKRLNRIDKVLLLEYERCKLHYSANWNFMTDDIKQMWHDRIKDWKEK